MNLEPDIFDYLETTSLEPHDDYTSEITYKDQKIIWNRLKQLQQELDQYKNNWEELKKTLNEMILDTKKPTVLNNREKMAIRSAIEHILNKMKELEEKSND